MTVPTYPTDPYSGDGEPTDPALAHLLEEEEQFRAWLRERAEQTAPPA